MTRQGARSIIGLPLTEPMRCGLRHHEPAPEGGLCLFMILFYIDEAGDPNPHHEPLFDGETPAFCLSAVAVDAARWRDLDRSLLALKRTYFALEMGRLKCRPERFEVKGSHLLKPSNARVYRNRVFTLKVLEVLAENEAKLFAVMWRKDAGTPMSSVSMYTHSLQVLSERFHHHCLAMKDRGLLIVDARTKTLDRTVAEGHLSFLFGHAAGRTYTSLTEAPLFADSVLSAGVQFADIVGSCIYGNFYRRRCHDIKGHFVGTQPASPKAFSAAPAAVRTIRAPARDYTHAGRFWTAIESMQFRRKDVAAPAGGTVVEGYYGFRELGSV